MDVIFVYLVIKEKRYPWEVWKRKYSKFKKQNEYYVCDLKLLPMYTVIKSLIMWSHAIFSYRTPASVSTEDG